MHGETAQIMQAKNPTDWADKVRMLIDNRDFYTKMAQAAHSYAIISLGVNMRVDG